MKTRTSVIANQEFTPMSEATITGVFLLIVPVLFTTLCILNNVQYYGTEVFIPIMAVGAVVCRIVAASWISTIAKALNRNKVQWIVFASLLPGVALTVIGYKQKLSSTHQQKRPAVASKALQLDRPLQWAS